MGNSDILFIDWDHVYLLGWYDWNRKAYLTSWDGNFPMVNVIVTGGTPVMWRGYVKNGLKLHEIPEGIDPHKQAMLMNGLFAFGWYIKDGIDRNKLMPDTPFGNPAHANGGAIETNYRTLESNDDVKRLADRIVEIRRPSETVRFVYNNVSFLVQPNMNADDIVVRYTRILADFLGGKI
jgi:hypothetical protein